MDIRLGDEEEEVTSTNSMLMFLKPLGILEIPLNMVIYPIKDYQLKSSNHLEGWLVN